MEEKTINLKELKIKAKLETAKRKIAETGKKAGRWIVENKELSLALAALGARTAISLSKSYRVHKESERRDCSFYDPRKGRYTMTKRKPTAREEAEIDRRYNAGESYSHILDDMRLAK